MHRLAGEEIAAPAVFAESALAPVPPDADTITHRPSLHARSDGIDAADHFVARDTRQYCARKLRVPDHRVAVTDAAGFDLDANFPCDGVRDRTLDELERPVGLRNLRDSHAPHGHRSLMGTGR
jgi:hypothetical protein